MVRRHRCWFLGIIRPTRCVGAGGPYPHPVDFAAAVAYLDRHSNLEANAGWVHGLSLAAMERVVALLGDPQSAYPVIHVTGTNGKGSTTRMIEAILGAHGLTVGTYTSPHLESLTERITRNGEPIPSRDFAEVMSELAAIEPVLAAEPPAGGPDRPLSWFELMTATALSWFAREAVDVAVVEVGLLGRYDATNVVDADVAVITNVAKDHTDGVGDWAARVAHEKAGIIKSRSHVVLGEVADDLAAIFLAEPHRDAWRRDVDFGIDLDLVAVGGHQVDLWLPAGAAPQADGDRASRSRLGELFLPAHGSHQVDNAVLAVAAVQAFFGRALDRDVVAEGLAAVELPGRFEVISRAPLVVLDRAHNPDGTAVVADTFAEEFKASGGLTLVVGLLTGRDPAETLAPLLRLAPARVVCTTAPSPRAVAARDLALAVEAAAGPRPPSVVVVPEVATALERELHALADDAAVIVTGSTYTVGAARTAARRLGLGS